MLCGMAQHSQHSIHISLPHGFCTVIFQVTTIQAFAFCLPLLLLLLLLSFLVFSFFFFFLCKNVPVLERLLLFASIILFHHYNALNRINLTHPYEEKRNLLLKVHCVNVAFYTEIHLVQLNGNRLYRMCKVIFYSIAVV